jgi:hypothetical protein
MIRCVRCLLSGNGLGDEAEYIHRGESVCYRHLCDMVEEE